MELLINHIKKNIDIGDEETDLILAAFVRKNLKNKEFLLSEGHISSHMRFIGKGCLRSYYLNEDGNEHILQFGIKEWWINDLYSYLTQTPAKHFIQAIEPSVILQIHRDKLEELYRQVPALERFFRIKMQNAYVATQARTINSMSQPAKQRYLGFCQKYREIEQRVPQYMIASYLGITPEHLSTIRKNLHA